VALFVRPRAPIAKQRLHAEYAAREAQVTDDQAEAILAELLVEVRAIRRLLEARAPRPAGLDIQDRRHLARLLPVLAAQFPDGFCVWECFDAAQAAGVVSASDMRLALGDLTAHALGKLLRRACDSGESCAGFRVTAAGRSSTAGGRRWVVDRSDFSGQSANASVPGLA
jgi:hypothetical protein